MDDTSQYKNKEHELNSLSDNNLFKNNFTKGGFDFHPWVSGVSAIILLIFIGYSMMVPQEAHETLTGLRSLIIKYGDWFFIIATNFIVLFVVYLGFSKLGQIRLGGYHAKPEFSNFSWYSMLISAGMGIGLMFYGVGEPIWHIASPPTFFESTSNPLLLQYNAIAGTFYHWGFHPWGVYALIALALAFFCYNRKLPLSLRSVFYPLIGDKIHGPIGNMVDTLAVLACLSGLATSLGIGAQQINAGLNYVFGVPNSTVIQIIIIICITLLATGSVISGIEKGVKFLSELNIWFAFAFMVCLLILGPTVGIIALFSNGLGVYLGDFIKISSYVGNNDAWQGSWTIFYWAWWISWSPFVGMFIARISKGRTIREFIIAVFLVPSLLSFLWLTVFAGNAFMVDKVMNGGLTDAVNENLATSLFAMIENLPILQELGTFGTIIGLGLSVLGIILVISFFVTSSDSGSLVVDNLTSGGKPDSPVRQRVFWALIEGILAISLLVAGGNVALTGMQAASVATGLPFAIILLFVCYSLHVGLERSYSRFLRIRDEELFNKLSQVENFGEKVAEALLEQDDVIESIVSHESFEEKVGEAIGEAVDEAVDHDSIVESIVSHEGFEEKVGEAIGEAVDEAVDHDSIVESIVSHEGFEEKVGEAIGEAVDEAVDHDSIVESIVSHEGFEEKVGEAIGEAVDEAVDHDSIVESVVSHESFEEKVVAIYEEQHSDEQEEKNSDKKADS